MINHLVFSVVADFTAIVAYLCRNFLRCYGCPLVDSYANLYLFDGDFGNYFDNYFSFGSSSVSKNVEAGMIRGRLFGGGHSRGRMNSGVSLLAKTAFLMTSQLRHHHVVPNQIKFIARLHSAY